MKLNEIIKTSPENPLRSLTISFISFSEDQVFGIPHTRKLEIYGAHVSTVQGDGIDLDSTTACLEYLTLQNVGVSNKPFHLLDFDSDTAIQINITNVDSEKVVLSNLYSISSISITSTGPLKEVIFDLGVKFSNEPNVITSIDLQGDQLSLVDWVGIQSLCFPTMIEFPSSVDSILVMRGSRRIFSNCRVFNNLITRSQDYHEKEILSNFLKNVYFTNEIIEQEGVDMHWVFEQILFNNYADFTVSDCLLESKECLTDLLCTIPVPWQFTFFDRLPVLCTIVDTFMLPRMFGYSRWNTFSSFLQTLVLKMQNIPPSAREVIDGPEITQNTFKLPNLKDLIVCMTNPFDVRCRKIMRNIIPQTCRSCFLILPRTFRSKIVFRKSDWHFQFNSKLRVLGLRNFKFGTYTSSSCPITKRNFVYTRLEMLSHFSPELQRTQRNLLKLETFLDVTKFVLPEKANTLFLQGIQSSSLSLWSFGNTIRQRHPQHVEYHVSLAYVYNLQIIYIQANTTLNIHCLAHVPQLEKIICVHPETSKLKLHCKIVSCKELEL